MSLRLGIYKLGFNRLTKEMIREDKNGMFTEIKLVMQAFKKNGYNKIDYVDLNSKRFYDRIFVFNGHESPEDNLSALKLKCRELNYILTDTRFLGNESRYSSRIDNYFVQSKNKFYLRRTFDSKLHRLPVFEKKLNFPGKINDDDKIDKLIFGGSVRQREGKIKEYLEGDHADTFLKYSEEDDQRIPAHEYKNKLKNYKFGLYIVDPEDAEYGNITWRLFEYIANRVCVFIDRDSDKHNLIYDNKDNFMYVSSREELLQKMDTVNSNSDIFRSIIEKQLDMVDLGDYTGLTFVNSLLERRNENVRRI